MTLHVRVHVYVFVGDLQFPNYPPPPPLPAFHSQNKNPFNSPLPESLTLQYLVYLKYVVRFMKIKTSKVCKRFWNSPYLYVHVWLYNLVQDFGHRNIGLGFVNINGPLRDRLMCFEESRSKLERCCKLTLWSAAITKNINVQATTQARTVCVCVSGTQGGWPLSPHLDVLKNS